MKKTLKLFMSVLMTFMLIFVYSFGNLVYANGTKIEESEYASYQEKETLKEMDLGYGIKYTNVKAISTAKRCNNQSDVIDSLQNVNFVSVPSRKDVRIVNFTYPNPQGWTKQTLTKVVERFENDNPGWTVIAGVNGDFYDIKGLDKALPYHTTGSALSNGDLLRVVESKSIGYKNDGSNNSFVATEKLTFSKNHFLTIYDENENIIYETEVEFLNTEPGDNQTAVYYTYKENVGGGTPNLITTTVPSQNSYIVISANRCLPTKNVVFAKGTIDKINETRELSFGQFAIVTKNEEVKEKLASGTLVRIQKKVTGDLEDCDQIQAVGSTLVENGIVSTNNSDGMREDRHPRTCIGIQENGNLFFCVIDGRQASSGMYGMTQDEQGVLMKYYGCTMAYNIDGGGSSTFGIRNEKGEFVVVNSPSDNNERQNANFLLITVPSLKMKYSDYTDTSLVASYGKISKDVEIKNVKVLIDNREINMTSNELLIDDLKPATTYQIKYNYDVTYKGINTNKTSYVTEFTTGKAAPYLANGYFDILDDTFILEYDVVDTEGLITFASVNYGNKTDFVTDISSDYIECDLSSLSNLSTYISIDYDVKSSPNRTSHKNFLITWLPCDVNYNEYLEKDVVAIEDIVKKANEKIVENAYDLTKSVEIIKEAREEISKIKTASEHASAALEMAKKDAKEKVYKSIEGKKYSKKNQEKVDQILKDFESKLNEATNLDIVQSLISQALANLNKIKTSNCKSSSATIVSIIALTLFIPLVVISKKRH